MLPKVPNSGIPKDRRVEILRAGSARFVEVHIRQQLIRSLVADIAEAQIAARGGKLIARLSSQRNRAKSEPLACCDDCATCRSSVNSRQTPSGCEQAQRVIRKLRRLDDACQVEGVSLVDFAISTVTTAVEAILIGMIHIWAVAVITPGLVVTDAMRQRVIRINVDAFAGPALYGNDHPVVILRAAVIDECESPNFPFECRIQETQQTAIIRVGQRRAIRARRNLEIGGLTIEETIAVGIANPWNVDRLIERDRRLKVCDLASDVAQRHHSVPHNFPLNAQIPGLSVCRG